MAPMDIKWSTDTGAGSHVTSTLVNDKGIYAAAYGEVFRLSRSIGNIIASNNLAGTGYHEVRLAAPADAQVLLVGTSGYVICLESEWLNEKWRKYLDDSEHEVTSVLCANGSVYAGSNGHVYRLNLESGDEEAHNLLRKYGKHEIRLDWNHGIEGSFLGRPSLVVGTNGWAFGLDFEHLGFRWKNGLPGSGHDVVSVVGDGNVVYAGSGGIIYRLDGVDGSQLHKNELKGVGTREVRLSLSTSKDSLRVGTNGYALGLRPKDLERVYLESLPGSGSSATDVVNLDLNTDMVIERSAALYANNGYVYAVDKNGRMQAKNLEGYGKDETRLALDSQDSRLIFVGIRGQVIALTLN
ncbi:MAG: hypothetical protein ASARMPREDX12_003213 [Alectoria sarmentosa]|nr:MAG: hypothetical protein ASARMPREDX12_003213 [Alectoria sarmentosa]